MKRTSSMVYKQSHEATDLYLTTTNDGDLHKSLIEPTIAKLKAKYRKGVYDSDKAVDMWYMVANEAAKNYIRKFGNMEDYCHIFSVTDRFTCAVDMEEYYRDHVME